MLGIADYRWETHGIPEAAVRMIQRQFAAHGLRFEADSVRAGVCGGIVLRNLTVDGGSRFPSLSAAVLRRDNPDATLSELCALAPERLTVSGLNHRLAKITEIYERLNKKGK